MVFYRIPSQSRDVGKRAVTGLAARQQLVAELPFQADLRRLEATEYRKPATPVRNRLHFSQLKHGVHLMSLKNGFNGFVEWGAWRYGGLDWPDV